MDYSIELAKRLGIKPKEMWVGALGIHLWEHKIINNDGNETKRVEIYPSFKSAHNLLSLMLINVFTSNNETFSTTANSIFSDSNDIEKFIKKCYDMTFLVGERNLDYIKMQVSRIEWSYNKTNVST